MEKQGKKDRAICFSCVFICRTKLKTPLVMGCKRKMINCWKHIITMTHLLFVDLLFIYFLPPWYWKANRHRRGCERAAQMLFVWKHGHDDWSAARTKKRHALLSSRLSALLTAKQQTSQAAVCAQPPPDVPKRKMYISWHEMHYGHSIHLRGFGGRITFEVINFSQQSEENEPVMIII